MYYFSFQDMINDHCEHYDRVPGYYIHRYLRHTYINLVLFRKGSSLAAIKGYLQDEWGVDLPPLLTKIKNFIVNSVKDGELIQRKGNLLNCFYNFLVVNISNLPFFRL